MMIHRQLLYTKREDRVYTAAWNDATAWKIRCLDDRRKRSLIRGDVSVLLRVNIPLLFQSVSANVAIRLWPTEEHLSAIYYMSVSLYE